MQDRRVISISSLTEWWKVISNLNTSVLEEGASSLYQMHGCEEYLGLKRLPDLPFPNLPLNSLASKKPSFKNLDEGDILGLRKWLLMGEYNLLLDQWAETILRYAEINHSTLNNKALSKFGSLSLTRRELLELCAFMVDLHYERNDLRFLNLALKMTDIKDLFSKSSITRSLAGDKNQRTMGFLQIRIWIKIEAALRMLEVIHLL